MKHTRKVIENKKNTLGGKYQRILGGEFNLGAASGAWRSHKTLFHIAAASILLDFITNETFTSEEGKRFREGVLSMGAFFSEANKEWVALSQQKSKKQEAKLKQDENLDN